MNLSLIEIPVPDGTAEAYVAHPPAGEGPGVLFFMDAIGVRPQIAAMCDRIASWGYVVLAPNVFHREGSVDEVGPHADLTQPGEREAFFEQAMPRVGRLTPDQAEPDIAAYLTALRGTDGVADGPVAAVGYCMGARLAVRAGTGHPDEVAAVGGFHGGGLVTADPDSPHRGLGNARAEFVFGHADQDRSMPAEAVAALGEALAAAGLLASNQVYPGAVHGYTMADTPMYDEPSTERHFTELRALLGRAL
jgi:carboxymethylenebutenolidase